MKRHLAGLIVTFVGATLMQIAASDTYLRFVRPGMRPLLLIAGAVLVIFAVIDVFAESNRSPKSATAHGDPRVGDSHGHSLEHSP